jgi:hypothetical protein
MTVLVPKYHTTAIKIIGMVTHRSHPFAPACVPNGSLIDSTLHCNTLDNGSIVFELSKLLQEIWSSPDAHGVKMVLPSSGPIVAAPIVHQWFAVASVVECILPLVIV